MNHVLRREKYAMRMTRIGNISIIWTSSTSDTDFDICYPTIQGARIGHLHFHTNLKTERVQVWILETRCWEEHAVHLNRANGLSIEDMVRDPYWLDLVRCAPLKNKRKKCLKLKFGENSKGLRFGL